MKKIEAIIKREKLNDVKVALDALKCPGMMVTEIEGHGKQKGITEQFRGREFRVDFLAKTRIEIVAQDGDVNKFVEAIVKAANTGQVGDGKIFVYNVEQAIRIRTSEKGDSAIS